MSEQLQLRRGTGSQVASFLGAQGEVVFDTTNNRIVANDGVTVGGNPAAKLAEVITNTRTAVSDASYTVLATDRTVAYTALTAARAVALPASSAYPERNAPSDRRRDGQLRRYEYDRRQRGGNGHNRRRSLRRRQSGLWLRWSR